MIPTTAIHIGENMDFKKEFEEFAFIYFNSDDETTKSNAKNSMINMVDKTIAYALPRLVDQYKLDYIRNVLCLDIIDMKQECMIILLNSMQTYSSHKGIPLYKYFVFNIRRRVQKLVFTCKMKKRAPSKNFSSYTSGSEDNDNQMPIELLLSSRIDGAENQYDIMIKNIVSSDLKEVIIKMMNSIEKDVVDHFFSGNNLSQTAKELNISMSKASRIVKSIKFKAKQALKAEL